jgi:hypothetical protein
MSPSQSDAQKQQAIDRVARQYYRVLASQEDFVKAKEKLLPGRALEEPVPVPMCSNEANLPAAGSFFDGHIAQPAFANTDLPLEEFYFGDPAAWTFDNLWAMD